MYPRGGLIFYSFTHLGKILFYKVIQTISFQSHIFSVCDIQIDLLESTFHLLIVHPTRPFRTNTQKDVLFIIGDWNAKGGSQETPGVTGKFGLGIRNEAGRRLIEFCQENALVITNTLFQQHKRRLYTWTSPDGQHRNQLDYILCSQRWRSSIQSAKTRPGADCGSDHELLIAKFRLKLKKVGKTSRPFRYDLNQIPCDYTVEVRNRFKGLDLIECLMNYGMRFVTLYRRQGSRPFP